MCLSLAVAGALLVGCQPPGPDSSEPSESSATVQRLESAELDLAMATVPEGFQVVDESQLRLRRTDDQAGEIWVEVGPERQSINLVQEVRDWDQRFKEMPDGEFKGQMELGTQFGTAYSVRGRYSEDDLKVEQFRMFSLHPIGYRLLSLVYTYPAGEDTTMRRDHIMEAFSQLEGLQAAPAEAAPTQEAPADEAGEAPAS